MVSLGCVKNLADAEVMLGSLMADGIEITNEPAEADALIVNTCSFINSAQEESVDAILESSELRAVQRPGQALIVSGCLPQRFRKELPELMTEVDAFMGVDQIAEVPRIVREAIDCRSKKTKNHKDEHSNKKAKIAPLAEINSRPRYIPDVQTPRFRLTPPHFAYVKIAEGCNHPCSFCIIPRMRGSHRSRKQADIVEEAKGLIAQGVKELNLISQDSTYYGMDLVPGNRRGNSSPGKFSAANASLPPNASTLCSLLRELNQIPGDFWIRLLYTHPAHWTDELIQTIAECSKVARYVDMPLQHIHDTMLERMRRETDGQYIHDLITRIREGIPGIAIRTTFIVGFPGETPELHMDTVRINRIIQPHTASCSIFTPFHGTPLRKLAVELGYMEDDYIAPANSEGSILNMPDFTKEQIYGKARTFNLYVKLPLNRYKDIEKAEDNTPEGDRIWEELKQEYFEKFGDVKDDGH